MPWKLDCARVSKESTRAGKGALGEGPAPTLASGRPPAPAEAPQAPRLPGPRLSAPATQAQPLSARTPALTAGGHSPQRGPAL